MWPSRLEPYSFLIELSPSAPNFEETPSVAIEQGGVAKVASDGDNEVIKGMTNIAVVLIADWFPGGEMADEH